MYLHTPDTGKEVQQSNPLPIQLTGSNVVEAGKKNATTVDQQIPANFNNISVINDGPNELGLCIEADSTAGLKIIYIAPGESFEKQLKGNSLHYSVASGAATFRYVLS